MNNRADFGLLFLHALPLDREMWSAQMSLLPTRTYLPNLYDFGDNIEVWAEKSLALVSEQQLIVVGCSVGGSCAVEVARLAPERVKALVLIGTKARHDPDPELREKTINLIKDQGVEAAWLQFWKPLFKEGRDDLAANNAEKIVLRQSGVKLINGLSAFHSRPDRESLLSSFSFPVHLIMGEEDEFPGIDYSRQLVETAQNGHLHMIKSCGHYVPIVKPKEFNALLHTILQSHSAL